MAYKKKLKKTSKAPSATERDTRDRLTRVASPIKGQVTQSKQWSRTGGWTP